MIIKDLPLKSATQQKLGKNYKVGFISFLFLLLLSFNTNGQEEFVKESSKLITKFKFKMLSGGVIIINAQLGDLPDTLNFVLDTGSGGISLDSATVAKLKLTSVKSNRTIRGIAGIRQVDFVLDQELKLPGLNVQNLSFHINDYELLTSVYGMKIDGIIGYSFLSRYIVKLDYDDYWMEVWTNGQVKYPRGGYLLKPQLSSIPIQDAILKDNSTVTANFYFDTGAGLCFLLSEDFVQDSSLFNKKSIFVSTQAEGLGGKKQMRLTTTKEVRIGPYKFKKVPTYIFDDDYNVTSYPSLGGLLGNEILRRFNVILNYNEKEIHLKPNTRYFEPFDYSYTGLGIYLIDSTIQVVDVLPNSPGEKAGFKSGDIIVAVKNNFTGNILEYKNLLQVPGAIVDILITRNGEPLILKLKVRNILRKR